MKLVSLTMHNFMPYRGEQQVVFPSDPGRNVMIVLGDNMRGKTSLLNALRWGFYGIARGRHLREIPLHLLLNTDARLAGDFEMEIAIRFDADGHSYDLRRRATKKRLVATPDKADDFDVAVHLQRDGMAMNGYQIEHEINRFVPEQVSRFFLFDGELLQEYETLLIEGSDQGKRIKEAIEQVLGVPSLINGRTESATLLRKAQRQQNTELAHLQGAQSHVAKQRDFQVKADSHEKDIEKLKGELSKTKEERTFLDDELESSESVHAAKQTIVDREKNRDVIIKDIDRLNVERLELVSSAWRDLLRPKILLRRDNLAAEQNRLTGQIGRRSSIDTEIKQLREILDYSTCPTCGQDVSSSRRDEVGTRLGVLEFEIKSIVDEQEVLHSTTAEIDRLNKLLTQGVGERIRDRDNQINRNEVALTKVENEIQTLKLEIEGYDTAEIARKRSIRDSLVREEGRIVPAITEAQRQLDNVKKELEIIGRALASLPQARAARSSGLVRIYAGLEKAFTESIESLRNNLRKHVESKASEAFAAMITQQSYSGLKINSNYGLSILDEHGRVIVGRSAGAEQIVALSLIDGLSRTGRSGGPVVMDTPFGRLDLKHRDNILKYLPTTTSQLVLLVHDGEIRLQTDLAPIAERIGMVYSINEVGPRHSVIERSSL